jgi:hypothetical protein
LGLTPKERAERARQLLDDDLLKEVLVDMERWAVENFMVATSWWTGDRRRRIAAEHLREVRDFKRRLDMALHGVPADRKRTIA